MTRINFDVNQVQPVRILPSLVLFFVSAAESTTGKLVEKEERAEGSVSWRVYLVYIRHLGFGVFFFQLLLLMGRNGLGIGTNYWLSAWSEHGNNVTKSANGSEVK